MREGLSPAERAAIAAFRGPVQRIPSGTYTDEVRNRWGKVVGRKLVMPGDVTPWQPGRQKHRTKRRATNVK